MVRKQQHEILVDFLRERGGRATIREIHRNCWIQNVPDAAMRARKKGFKITTEKDPVNPKIASYVLHEVSGLPVTTSEAQSNFREKRQSSPALKQLFPTPTNPYRE